MFDKITIEKTLCHDSIDEFTSFITFQCLFNADKEFSGFIVQTHTVWKNPDAKKRKNESKQTWKFSSDRGQLSVTAPEGDKGLNLISDYENFIFKKLLAELS